MQELTSFKRSFLGLQINKNTILKNIGVIVKTFEFTVNRKTSEYYKLNLDFLD